MSIKKLNQSLGLSLMVMSFFMINLNAGPFDKFTDALKEIEKELIEIIEMPTEDKKDDEKAIDPAEAAEKEAAALKKEASKKSAREKQLSQTKLDEYLASMAYAEKCQKEYMIDQKTKNLATDYLKKEVKKLIDSKIFEPSEVNKRLQFWKAQVAGQGFGMLGQMCPNIKQIAAAVEPVEDVF